MGNCSLKVTQNKDVIKEIIDKWLHKINLKGYCVAKQQNKKR